MVGIIHQLPFANVDLLLGNDLSDRCCHTGGEIVEVCGWPVGIEQQSYFPRESPHGIWR